MTKGDVADLIQHYMWRQHLDRNDSLRSRFNAVSRREELLCTAVKLGLDADSEFNWATRLAACSSSN